MRTIAFLVAAALLSTGSPLARAESGGNLRLRLAADGRMRDLIAISLARASSSECSADCRYVNLLNAARAHLLIGDYEGAQYYATLSTESGGSGRKFADAKAIKAYAALLAGDVPLWNSLSADITSSSPELKRQFDLAWHLDGPSRSDERSRELVAEAAIASEVPEVVSAGRTFRALPRKSPAAAAILSALVPGGGFGYLGLWQSAATSLLLTGVSAAAAIDLYSNELPRAGLAAALIGSVFYVGGIASAYRSAEDLNRELSRPAETSMRSWAIPQLSFTWDL